VCCAALVAATVVGAGCMRASSQPAQSSRSSSSQSVAMDLRGDYDGRIALHAFSLGPPAGVPYVIDASKLTFTAQRYGRPDDPGKPVDITVGSSVYVPPPEVEGLREYSMPVAFGGPPDGPGMYDVTLHAAEGFARTQSDGTPLRFGDWSRFGTARWHVLVYWPDERSGDAALRRLSDRLAGTTVYGYGGITIECQPRFVNSFDAHVGVHVRKLTRDIGTVQRLWMGIGSGSLDSATNFFAVDPLRVLVDVPDAKPRGTGGTTITPDDRCPKISLADWQVDLTLSTAVPPASLPDGIFGYGKITDGMSRSDVVWRIGYPPEFATVGEINRETTWTYDYGGYAHSSVEFRDDRVTSYEPPNNGP
jgi:hypothetical protein